MKSLKRHILKEVILLMGISLSSGYVDLSRNKTTDQTLTWLCPPENLKCKNLYISSNAVDRDTLTCAKNSVIGGSSNDKTVWWKVDMGDIYSIYSISILFKDIPGHENRQRGRFAGFSLYLSESGNRDNNSLCYKDGPDIPPLNFTTTNCTGYGRYVFFYNERLDGVSYPDGYESNSYTELCEVIVKGCNKTSYGRNCDKRCSVNCENQRCNIVNGTCLRCKPGWTGNLCGNKCPGGRYGLGCEQQCTGHCLNNDVCNHVNGSCDNGCASGWMGNTCEKSCRNGTYGPGCKYNCSGHCLNDAPCDKKNGHCNTGCKPGYRKNLCNKACIPGYYGNQCKELCSQNCLNDKTCNHIDGVCTNGCKDGYVGERCKQSCQKGYFGRNCSGICSERCIDICKITDGSCICAAGWRGANCSEECSQSYGKNCQTPCSKFCVNSTCDRFNGSCLAGCNEGAYGDKCYQGVVAASQISNTSSSGTLTIVGVVVAIAVIIVLAVLVILLIRYKRKSSEMSAKRKDVISIKPLSSLEQVNRESLLEHSNLNNADVIHYSNDNDVPNETAMRGRPTNKCIPVNNLQAIISSMSASEDAGFKNEYQDIPKGELHPCEEAKRPENKPKNRYTTTFPYDHSRVLLKTTSPSDGDYINANYIEDVQGKPSYIATQGPKPKTIADFWRMIWQEDVSVIVCLTNLKEGAKNKCAQYWPNINDKLQTGGFNIRNMEEKVYANYTKRLFKVYKHLEQKDREVVMFHYTRWPDHGVPDPLSLVLFHRHVMKTSSQYPGKYFVVHCSAGIGRTGTYIALDALYREGERTGKVNVPMYVRTMRKDRMNMIQGDEQYKTVYLVLYESFRGKSRCMTTEQILQEYQGKSCYANCEEVTKDPPLSSDFKELLSLRKTYTEKVYEYGRANISANYTKDVLPVEEFMCRLSYSKGRLTYYNAVFHQSYKENDSLISAQYPLQAYTEDFLRLIKDVNARVVVFLCPLSDLEYSSHWFPSKNMDKTVGSFTIKLTSCETSANVSKTNIILKPKGSSSMKITVLECPKWKEGQSIADIRDLVDVVKEAKTENFGPGSRLITLSSDGATRCGAFLVVYNALEQLSMDQEVDIFTISRQLQIRRPEFLSTLEEYQLSHEALAEYLRNDSVYANC